MIFLQAALNGERLHPAAPRTAASIAREARAAIDAGAHSVHVHAFDEQQAETLDARACSDVLRAIRGLSPGVPVSLTTSAAIIPDPAKRLAIIQAWTDLPELVTVNQGEPGILELSEWLLARGVALEAGLLCVEDARKFIASPLRHRCRRVLVEPLDRNPQQALRHAAEMEDLVTGAGIALEQVHHGEGVASWAVNLRAIRRGHGIRTGIEDTPVLADGSLAQDNAQLVRTAVSLLDACP